jgi:hypothetical protein
MAKLSGSVMGKPRKCRSRCSEGNCCLSRDGEGPESKVPEYPKFVVVRLILNVVVPEAAKSALDDEDVAIRL